MRDAFGGIVNIVIIVVFLVIVSGYMAYTVNYTKAFRVKNKIISTFEQYDLGCETNNPSSRCNTVIAEYMEQVGYAQVKPDERTLGLAEGAEGGKWNCLSLGYCWAKFVKNNVSDDGTKVYYKVATWVNMDIPIINRILPTLFQVRGDTKLIEIN